jgi:hypothetical protein
MLMVVIGDGASYDSSPAESTAARGSAIHRRGVFADARRQFNEFHELIPELLPRAGRTIERSLQRLQDEGDGSPERRRQLTAVRYYLQYAFRDLSQRWLGGTAGVTNYRALLGLPRIGRWSSDCWRSVRVRAATWKAAMGMSADKHCSSGRPLESPRG